MLRILFAGGAEDWPDYEPHLRAAFEEFEIAVDLREAFADPRQVDYIIYAPSSGLQDFAPFSRLQAVLSLWAGVETIVGNATITVPLCRMVDPGLKEGMVEWVTGHVLRHHLEIDQYLSWQDGIWRTPTPPPLAQHRNIGILGLGALGRACAEALSRLNFPVNGWSRREKQIEGITCFSGADGLSQVLAVSDILVLLLPQTADTENILDRSRLALLPKGAAILNPGRGALIDDTALLAALDADALSHATLDVFRAEPLPGDHRFWAHPKVTVTPHIASATRADTASRMIAQNVARGENGEPYLHVVDLQQGY